MDREDLRRAPDGALLSAIARDDGAAFAAGRLMSLVDQLPGAERQAVRSRVVDDRSYREIATEMLCSEMVVRKRVSRKPNS